MATSQQKAGLLKIENLKNLHNFEIDFASHSLTAILGVNGCGKSTILHALACCYKPADEKKSTNYKFSYFFTPTTHSIWVGSKFTLFHEYRVDSTVHSNVETVYSKEALRWKPIYARRIERHVSFIGIKTCVPKIEEETKESLIKYTTTVLSDEISLKIKDKASYVMNRNYDAYNVHNTAGKVSYIGVRCAGREYSSLSMGAGEQRVFTILTQVFSAPKYGLILIDEIDLLLHHDALCRLVETLVKRAADKNLQIVFTTHDQSIIDFKDRINIRHILQTPVKTLCFNETKPDAIYRLTGKKQQPLEFFVEDDLAKALVKKICGELGLSKYVAIQEFGAATNCFTTVAAALLKEDENIDNMVAVLDGDIYKTSDQKNEMVAKVLTGDTPSSIAKRGRAIKYICQFSMPDNLKPEQYLHQLITQLSDQDNEEYNEIIKVAKDIVAVDNSHEYIDDILKRMDFERAAGLKVIADLISMSTDWQYYTLEIRNWLSSRRERIIENV